MIAAAILALLMLPPQAGGQEIDAAYEYLFTQEQRAAFVGLASQQEKNAFLADFWQSQDPSPETDYNELRELFLQRMEVANFYYSLDLDVGWRSDRGKVLIFFGYPSMIRRSRFGPFDDSKFEIWIYGEIRGEDTVEIVFEDEFDSGDFVLRTRVTFPPRLSLSPELPRIAEEEDESR
ncbi:MAG TPA: GWxTD domain-containing protein [Acidobacteriota bacterium]|nr:GWxTD domain-containing protein [Acidobacteriota bacterium]